MKKLTSEDIAKIAMMRALGYSQKEIADKFNVSQTTVTYNLKKLRMRAKSEGDDKVFADIVVKVYNIPVDRLVKYAIKEVIK